MNRFATQRHRSLVEQMANSAFCLIMPGNSQSSQRLTEAFLTGCIPVFLGPPWHSLPLTQKVRSCWRGPCLRCAAPIPEHSGAPVLCHALQALIARIGSRALGVSARRSGFIRGQEHASACRVIISVDSLCRWTTHRQRCS